MSKILGRQRCFQWNSVIQTQENGSCKNPTSEEKDQLKNMNHIYFEVQVPATTSEIILQ